MKRAQQSFKVLAVLFVSAWLVLAVPPSARAQDNPDNQASQGDYTNVRIVRLSFVEGDVQYQRGEEGWQTALMNLPIQEGFQLATGNGRAEIEFESGLIVRLADNSQLDFTQLALLNGGRVTQLTVAAGTVIVSASLNANDALTIIAPNLQVGVSHITRFRVDTAQGDSWVTVMKGDVAVTSAAGDSQVTIGHTLHISGSNPDQVSVDKSAEQDDFDRWAAERDGILQRKNSQAMQSLQAAGPAALDYTDNNYGLADLYGYGDFIDVPGYGSCWSPYGVSANWMPFWNGKMVFFPGFGWTWMSSEPWGWLPFHTGHWFFVAGHGWFWQIGPVRAWNPAPVNWVRVGNQIGWTPLGVSTLKGTPGGPWIVTAGAGRPGEIRPMQRLQGGPVEVSMGAPPAAPAPVAQVRQLGPGVPASSAGGARVAPFNSPAAGSIRRDPKTGTYVNDNPPMRPVRTGPVVGPGRSTGTPPNHPAGVVTPPIKTANPVPHEQTKGAQQPPAPAATPTPAPPAEPQQQASPPQRYYSPPPQPQQRSSPPPSAAPSVQHSSPQSAPVQHSSPPPSSPSHGSGGGGGGGGGGSRASSSSSSSGSAHHR